MASIIRHEDNSIGAPDGMFDDDWMSRLITGYVAHRLRPVTELYKEPERIVFRMTTPAERVAQMVAEQEERFHDE